MTCLRRKFGIDLPSSLFVKFSPNFTRVRISQKTINMNKFNKLNSINATLE